MKKFGLFQTGKYQAEYYKGILIRAWQNLHNEVITLVKKYAPPPATVLDIGTGEGAFAQRLLDNGYEVEGCDIDTNQFKAQGIKTKIVDFNQPLESFIFDKKYDLVVAIEIIEHLQNPWKFISDCKSLAKKNSLIVITTPNITSFLSRYIFLRTGEFLSFSKEGRQQTGHINPLSTHELEMIFEKYQLEIIYRGTGGHIPLISFPEKGFSLRDIFRNLMMPFFCLLMGGSSRNGLNLIYILRVK